MVKNLFVIILLLAIGAGVYMFFLQDRQTPINVNSFEECVAAGYPVLESYPPKCNLPDGRGFTQEVGNELEYVDEITIANPRPNQTAANPLEISGQARGSWFFEASFAGELEDENGNNLGVAILQAEGEWMTEDFVPFKGSLQFTNPSTKTGKLIIKNANPSGLPENEKELVIPVKFE